MHPNGHRLLYCSPYTKKKSELKVRPEVLLEAGQVDLRTDLFDCQMYVLSRQALRILAAHPNMTSLKVTRPLRALALP